MLLKFLYPFADLFSAFNLFKYITFRTGGAVLTALLFCFITGNRFISWLKSKQKDGQPIRDDGPESHLLTKQGTPTMGGVMILSAVTLSTILWTDISNIYVWTVLGVTLLTGFLGGIDDYLKLTKRSHKGLSGKQKLLGQCLISILAMGIIYYVQGASIQGLLTFPFMKNFTLDLGLFFFIWGAFVVVGSSNAVNLTDGLDGLAIMPVILCALVFCIIAYVTGNKVFADYLQIMHVKDTGELCIYLGALIGAGLGFLWFNAPPAKVFMGDTGSLAVGAGLGTISIMTKHEFVFALCGGLFVMEALSVMIQVAYYKLRGKRVFLMAPIHHHFEKKGWSEPTVVIRFWIIAFVLALLALFTLKIR